MSQPTPPTESPATITPATAHPPRPAPSRRRRRPRLAVWAPPLAVLAAVVGLWYAASYLLLAPDRRFLAPPPHQVLRVGFGDPANLAELLGGLALSTQVAMAGLGIAILAGMSVAILMHQATWLERSLYPYAVIIQAMPILALVPLIGFWLDYGLPARVLVCVLIALFPIIANTLFGLQSVPRAHRDLFRLHRAGRLARLIRLELPSALPAILTGFRISAGLSVIGSIVGDYYFRQGTPGLGVLLDLYRARLEAERLYAAVLLSSALGVAVFWAFGLGRLATSWHESARDPTRH